MSNDPQYSNIPLLVTFLKSYKRAYLGMDEQEDSQSTPSGQELVSADYREKFRTAFETYYKTAGKALVKGYTVSSTPYAISHSRRFLVLASFYSVYWSRTSATKKRTSKPERYLKIGNTPTREWSKRLRSCRMECRI
jgi:hypothetical protein